MSITPLMPVYPRCGVRPVRGEHCHLVSEDGTRYLDFAAGIAVNLLGHSHEGLIGAIQRQAATLMHVSNLYGSPQGEALAQRLVELTFADTVFFTNSGAEAVECAIKTARSYHQHAGNEQKFELITFNNAFHGRTMGALALTHKAAYREPFEPLPGGVEHLPFGDLDALESAMADDVAALVLEPLQGEAGVRRLPAGYLAAARELTSRHGALLILDEVQTGMGRTGRWMAHHHEHIGGGRGDRRPLPAAGSGDASWADGGRRAPLRYRGGCARNLQDLVSEVSSAIDARDGNRLARSYHWVGMGHRSGYAMADRLDAIARRPLLNITALRPAQAVVVPTQPSNPYVPATAATIPREGTGAATVAGTSASAPPSPRRPVALRIDQVLDDGISPSTTTFGLRRHMDCWWISL